MTDPRTTRLNLAELLMAVENAPPVAAADVLGDHLEAAFGASGVSLLVADLSGRALIRLGHGGIADHARTEGRETAERVSLVGSPQGRALAGQTLVVEDGADGARVFAPVTNRGEAIGVLELTLREAPDEQTLVDLALAAHALAYVVIANRRFTDLFEWGQRSVPLSLAAEVQHRLLPDAFTCEAGQFTLAAWLEPAGEVAGDTFDFAIERDTLHLSMTDAMGHSIDASILATVLVSGLRNARRAAVGLGEEARLANAGLFGYAEHGGFVTGQVARIDLRTETATIVNAGHPAPLRLRSGQLDAVDLAADPPFGILRDAGYRVQRLPLEPGDRLMFLTDGVLERHAAAADVAQIIASSGAMHPREAVQHLVQAVLEGADGKLTDDATVMCLDWHGGRPRERTTDSGAND